MTMFVLLVVISLAGSGGTPLVVSSFADQKSCDAARKQLIEEQHASASSTLCQQIARPFPKMD